MLPVQTECSTSFMGSIPYAVYAVILTVLVCKYNEHFRFEDLNGHKDQLIDVVGDFACMGYNPSEEDVKKLRSGLVTILEYFSVVLRGNAFQGSQREKIEQEMRIALLQLRGSYWHLDSDDGDEEVIVQYHDATEADALLSSSGDINFEAKRDLSHRRERDSDAHEAALAADEGKTGYEQLKERVECAYFIDMGERAHWAGLSHAFYNYDTPVVLDMLDAVADARGDEELLDTLHSLRCDVMDREVARRTLGQLGKTNASMLRHVLLAQQDCAAVHEHVNTKYVVDEIFRRIDEDGHLRTRKTNREVEHAGDTPVSDDLSEAWD